METVLSTFNFLKKQLHSLTQSPELESELILREVLNYSKASFLAHLNTTISTDSLTRINALLTQRLTEKPLAYVLGHTDFMGKRYQVDEGVLIPRSETELLVEEAFELIDSQSITHVFELGFGTGVISLELAQRFPALTLYAWDINPKAYQNAVKNSRSLGLSSVRWHLGSFFSQENPWIRYCESDTPTLVITNPPYISQEAIQTLDMSVREFEPLSALEAPHDGLWFYEELLKPSRYFKHTALAFEMGFDQKTAITALIQKSHATNYRFFEDYQGLDRGGVVQF